MALFLSQIKIFAPNALSGFFPKCPLLSELQVFQRLLLMEVAKNAKII